MAISDKLLKGEDREASEHISKSSDTPYLPLDLYCIMYDTHVKKKKRQNQMMNCYVMCE